MKKYNNLFTPLTVRSMTMKNRIAMTPMGTNFGGEGGDFTEEHMQYYEQRAMGGVGLIIVENACVDFPLGSNGTTQIRLTEDRFIPALYELTERIHKHGACAAIQINHSGASAVPSRIGGLTPVSASNIPSKTGGAIPRPLTKEEIVEIAEKYAQAARRAQMAGFDAVEIHGGHSYLLCQFLSPIYNNRTDEFGGSLENRARFARLVIDKVREAVGPFFPIMLRISADEFVKGGNTLEDGWRAYMAEAVKKKFNKPTITTGNIRSPKIADEILGLEKADIIGMGRGLIAEPNWVNKVMAGKEETLRKCISCNIGCADNRIAKNRGIRFTINPDVIYEDSYKNKKVKKAINVVVIGGGTAGLEAACTAAEVGCTTFLLEEKPYLGGLVRKIAKLPEKDRINDFSDYLIDRANKLKNLIVFTNTKANTEVVANLKPDVIVNATGSTPLLPPIKGLLENIDKENGKVNSIFGLMKDVNRFDFEGKKVAVIGGGAVGLDVVELFATRGAEVSIVERLPMLGRDLDIVTKIGMLSMVKENNVNVLTSTSLLEVKENSFVVEKDAVQEELEFDYGFVCLGMRNYAPILGELQEYFLGTDVEIINIGDSVRARRIIDGIKEGRNIVTTLEKIGAFINKKLSLAKKLTIFFCNKSKKEKCKVYTVN